MSELENLEIDKQVIEKLRGLGIVDAMAVATMTPSELSSAAEISVETAANIIEKIKNYFDKDEFSTGIEIYEKRKEIERISTGSKNLDTLLGGGIQTQAITEAHGAFASGKSQLAFQLCISAAIKGRITYFIDTENTFRPERIVEICKHRNLDHYDILGKIKIARADNSDHQMLLVEKIEKRLETHGDNVTLIVIDSLTSHFRVDYAGRNQLAERQQRLNRHLHTLQRIADLYNIAVYVTNQVMAKPDLFFTGLTEAIGGHIVGHAATYRLFLRKTRGEVRVARLIDAPELPEGETRFKITAEGIVDI